MEKGEDREHSLSAFLGVPVPGNALKNIGDEIAVGQHGALADAGRPSGILEQRNLLRVAGNGGQRPTASLLQKIGIFSRFRVRLCDPGPAARRERRLRDR